MRSVIEMEIGLWVTEGDNIANSDLAVDIKNANPIKLWNELKILMRTHPNYNIIISGGD